MLTASAAPRYFRASLPVIEDVIAFHGTRGRLRFDEREEFRSWALEKLIENDYARLRKFQGRSSLRSFLSVVVANLLVDFWERRGGRRRPSSVARQLAPEGVWLEKYLGFGYTVAEAIQMVRSNHESPLTEDELFHIALRLPLRRARLKAVPESLADRIGTVDTSPERLAERTAEDASRTAVEDALDRALEALSPEERVFVRMRFEDGSRINEIAKAFHESARPFYRRFQGTLRRLRRELEVHGIDAACISLYRSNEARVENFRARAV